MTIKITTPNGGSDSLDFGCAQTPIVATVTGTEVSSGEGKLELKTTTGGTSATRLTIDPNGRVQIDGEMTDDFLVIKTTEAGTGSAPDVVLYRSSSSPADSDSLGKVVFRGRNDNSQDVEYAQVIAQAIDVSDGTEDGKLYLQTIQAGSHVNNLILSAEGNHFTGNVGIGTSAPNAPLHVVGLTRMQRDIDESSAYTGQLVLNSVTKSAGQLARIMFSHDDHGSASIASDYESSGYGNLIFSTRGGGNPTERMRITSDGRGVSQFTARAWVNFNGTGTLSVRDSHNVSSVTDNGTGSYTVNIDTDMANINYSIALSASTDTGPTIVGTALTDWHPITNGYSYRTVGAFRVGTVNGSWSSFDPSSVNAQVFGD